MSARLQYQGQSVQSLEHESVLDALLRVGMPVAFSCKGGACHTCLMQCVEGEIPERAQQGLNAHLVRMRYLLPCKCLPQSDMTLRPPQPDDLLTPCLLCELSVPAAHSSAADGSLQIIFEPQSPLRYRKGQILRVVMQGGQEPEIVITSDPAVDIVMHGELRAGTVGCPVNGVGKLPPGWGPEAEFGLEFEVRGPFDATPVQQLPMPATDAALWQELEEGRLVRAVLEDFYPQVYADTQLAPFFRGVTMQRVIDKQYSFLWQAMTGHKAYFGDRPRNAHHWMIITHELFDLRQSLMLQSQRKLGLSDAQIARWNQFEEYFRPDMVKSRVWPRLEHGVEVMNDGFEREVLQEGSLCDHCGQEVASGVQVLYHRRLGTISCPECAPAST